MAHSDAYAIIGYLFRFREMIESLEEKIEASEVELTLELKCESSNNSDFIGFGTIARTDEHNDPETQCIPDIIACKESADILKAKLLKKYPQFEPYINPFGIHVLQHFS